MIVENFASFSIDHNGQQIVNWPALDQTGAAVDVSAYVGKFTFSSFPAQDTNLGADAQFLDSALPTGFALAKSSTTGWTATLEAAWANTLPAGNYNYEVMVAATDITALAQRTILARGVMTINPSQSALS